VNNGSGLLELLSLRAQTVQLFGYVNPNSKNESVLAALFFNYDLDQSFEYPNQVAGYGRVGVEQAKELAKLILPLQPIAFRSALSQIAANSIVAALAASPDWEQAKKDNAVLDAQVLKEAVMAAAVELIEPKQQMYTIVMAAQAGKVDEQGNFNPTAEKRALAVLWRDPILDADGEHPCFVRFLKWIDWE
jgi:hypothetical protein